MPSRPTPYISLVAASRNDDHGKDMAKRMRLFVRGLLEQTRKHGLAAELIIVEWNPPPDKPLLHEVLPQPGVDDVLTIRYIQVPPQVHNRYKLSGQIPLYQMIAKNVGIRRAKAPFILCTNVDLLFSDALIGFLARQELDPAKLYRANRVDVPADLDESLPLDRQLEWCARNILRVNGRRAGLLNIDGYSWLMKQSRLYCRLLNWLSETKRRATLPPETIRYLQADLEACGDFTLLHTDAWHRMEGYVELDLYSINIDTMGVFTALALGYEQVVLPPDHCTYHIDHEAGWSSMDDVEKVRFLATRPGLNGHITKASGLTLIHKRTTYQLNNTDWGLATETLPEITL
jgi:hypothetical protein